MFVLLVAACIYKWNAHASQPADVIQWDSFETQLEAAAAVEPLLTDVRKLAQEVLPIFIRKHWWDLAKRVIVVGHEQNIDVSYVVRKAVSAVKDEADMLVRRLDPNHGVAQEVTPAFMWAQNNTHIFLSIKYSARWNAPGALEVKDPTLVCAGNKVTFTASGSHSKKLFAYKLELDAFDALRSSPSGCKFSVASVGKGYILLQKLRSDKEWPRLLASKVRPGNMHFWADRQHQLDEQHSWRTSTTLMAVSPHECVLAKQFWCEASEKCVDNCAQCVKLARALSTEDGKPGDTHPRGTGTSVETAGGQCIHHPSADYTQIQFKDKDPRAGYIQGAISVLRTWSDGNGNRFDDRFTSFQLYWGLTETEILQPFPVPLIDGYPRTHDLPVTPIPHGARYIIARARNVLGESENSAQIELRDFALPSENAQEVSFQDHDVLPGKITGNVTIVRAQNESSIIQYVVYLGKSKSQKIGEPAWAHIDVASLNEGEDIVVPIIQKTVPEKASHFIVFTSNDSGESQNGVSTRIRDVALPCSGRRDKTCVFAPVLARVGDKDLITFKNVKNALKYVVYSAEEDCPELEAYAKPKERVSETDAPLNKKDEVTLHLSRPQNEAHRVYQIYVIAKNIEGESQLCTGVRYLAKKQQEHRDELRDPHPYQFPESYSDPYFAGADHAEPEIEFMRRMDENTRVFDGL